MASIKTVHFLNALILPTCLLPVKMFTCQTCNKWSFLLSCGHVAHVESCPMLLHRDQCLKCLAPLATKDTLFIVGLLRGFDYFNLKMGSDACPEEREASPVYDPRGEAKESPYWSCSTPTYSPGSSWPIEPTSSSEQSSDSEME